MSQFRSRLGLYVGGWAIWVVLGVRSLGISNESRVQRLHFFYKTVFSRLINEACQDPFGEILKRYGLEPEL